MKLSEFYPNNEGPFDKKFKVANRKKSSPILEGSKTITTQILPILVRKQRFPTIGTKVSTFRSKNGSGKPQAVIILKKSETQK